MSDYVVFRYVNVFYFVLFIVYAVIFLIFIIPRLSEQKYKNAFRVFYCTAIVGISMEFYGTFSGIRVFYIGGEVNFLFQLLIQVSIGFGEGGAAMGVIYLMVEAVYEKDSKNFILYWLSQAILMLTFASFTILNS